jgi:hypothetical protein
MPVPNGAKISVFEEKKGTRKRGQQEKGDKQEKGDRHEWR